MLDITLKRINRYTGTRWSAAERQTLQELLRDQSNGGKTGAEPSAALADYDAIALRATADTERRVRQLTERILAEMDQLLKEKGESRSPEQWKGLRWGAATIAKIVYGVAEPLFYLSPLDTGVGKTTLSAAAIRVIMRDPELKDVSIVYFINRRELTDDYVTLIGLARDDRRLCVYFAQSGENLRWNSLGVGPDKRPEGTRKKTKTVRRTDGTKEHVPNPLYLPPPQNEAQLLITSQELLKSRSRWGPNFETNDLWQFKGRGRTLRIWDEASPPAEGITLTIGQIATYAGALPASEADELFAWVQKLNKTDNDKAVLVPGWSTPLMRRLRRKLKPTETEEEQITFVRSTLAALEGKLVRVLRDEYYGVSIITYSAVLPYNLPPMLIFDAQGDRKEVYKEWQRRRGDLVIGTAGTKEALVYVKHWNRAAGRAEHRKPSDKAELVEAAVISFQEALAMGATKVLLITFKPSKPSYAIEPDVRVRLRQLGVDDSALIATTWGGGTTATNEYKDICHQIHVGQLQWPLKDYIALQRASAGVADREPFDMDKAHDIRRSEVSSAFNQAVGRGTSRKMMDGKSVEPMYVWAVYSSRGRMGIPADMPKALNDHTQVEDWAPLGVKLRGGRKKTDKLPLFSEEVLLPRAGGPAFTEKDLADGHDYSPSMIYRFLRDPDLKAWLEERGWELKGAGTVPGRGGAQRWQLQRSDALQVN